MSHPYREEKPLAPPLRWNMQDCASKPVLQQQWYCREGNTAWLEWRDVPVVCEPNGVKTPYQHETFD